MDGISYWIEKRSLITPGRIAVITEDYGNVTYEELHKRILRMAGFLKADLSVEKGDRIAILSQNSINYLALLFAIAKLEAVAVPLNIRLTINELAYQVNDSGTKLLFADQDHSEKASALAEVCSIQYVSEMEPGSSHEISDVSFEPIDENASFLICYTSGTTGKPKGAVLTQKNMFWNAINNMLAIDLTSNDRSIVLLPLFHIGGIGLFALPTLFTGGTVIIPGKFEAEKALKMIERCKATIVMGVPAIHQALLGHPAFSRTNLESVRWFYNGGAPCPSELFSKYKGQGHILGQGFGMTETSPTLFMLSREDADRKPGSIGKPVMYSEYELLDANGQLAAPGEVGEIAVRGPNIMKQYWNRPDATEEAWHGGWFLTGDLARKDEEGFLYIVGRKKEMIISGGENIYPLEVEQAIGQLKEVKEVAVVGVSDSKWGEVPVAFVVLEDEGILTSDEVKEHCGKHLGRYKIPKEIRFLHELPKNATGKIQKNALGKIIQK